MPTPTNNHDSAWKPENNSNPKTGWLQQMPPYTLTIYQFLFRQGVRNTIRLPINMTKIHTDRLKKNLDFIHNEMNFQEAAAF